MEDKFARKFDGVCNYCEKPFTFEVEMKDVDFKGTTISVPAYKDQFRKYCSAKCFGKYYLREIHDWEALMKKMCSDGYKMKVCANCGLELFYKCEQSYGSCPCVLYSCVYCGFQNCDKIEMHSFDIDAIKEKGGYANLFEEIVDFIRVR